MWFWGKSKRKKDQIDPVTFHVNNFCEELKALHRKYHDYIHDRYNIAYYRIGAGVHDASWIFDSIDYISVNSNGDVIMVCKMHKDVDTQFREGAIPINKVFYFDKDKNYIEGAFSSRESAKKAYAEAASELNREKIQQLESTLAYLKGQRYEG